MNIRPVQEGDRAAVRGLVEAAFGGTVESRLVDLLRASGKAVISLAAVEGAAEVMGHILFSPVTVEIEQAPVRMLGLAPLAVSPHRQGQGIGSALMRAGLDQARTQGWELVVVLGEPEYYHRFGFRRAVDFGLGNEYGGDEEFMVLELVPGALAKVSGLVKYAPEFAAAMEGEGVEKHQVL